MTSVQGRGRFRLKHPSVTPSVAPSVAPFVTPFNFFPLPESGDELFDQLAGLPKTKPLVNASAAATNVPKYSKDNLQQIFKAVLEAQAPAPAPAPAPAVFEAP